MKRFFSIGLFLLVTCCLHAQQLHRHVLKCDLSAFFNDSYSLVYEYRINQKTSIELQGYFKQYESPGADIFNGDWINHYAERRTDTLHSYFNEILSTSGWQYLTEARPLPSVASFVPQSTLQISFGFQFAFEKKGSPWRVFLQPGCVVTGHRFFEINETILVENNIEKMWTEGSYPHEFRVKRRTMGYRQTRSMRQQNTWQVGLRYDAGIARKFGKHLLLEGRIATGANLWLPYEDPSPPAPAGRFWVRPSLLAGWAF